VYPHLLATFTSSSTFPLYWERLWASPLMRVAVISWGDLGSGASAKEGVAKVRIRAETTNANWWAIPAR